MCPRHGAGPGGAASVTSSPQRRRPTVVERQGSIPGVEVYMSDADQHEATSSGGGGRRAEDGDSGNAAAAPAGQDGHEVGQDWLSPPGTPNPSNHPFFDESEQKKSAMVSGHLRVTFVSRTLTSSLVLLPYAHRPTPSSTLRTLPTGMPSSQRPLPTA